MWVESNMGIISFDVRLIAQTYTDTGIGLKVNKGIRRIFTSDA